MLSEGIVQRKVGEFCPQMDIQSYNKHCVEKKGAPWLLAMLQL